MLTYKIFPGVIKKKMESVEGLWEVEFFNTVTKSFYTDFIYAEKRNDVFVPGDKVKIIDNSFRTILERWE